MSELTPQQMIVNYFVEEGLIPEDMSYEEIAEVAVGVLAPRPAEVERLRAELADMVPRDWHGLMAILDYAYPEAIFPTTEDAMTRDPGPRIVSLIRHLDQARAELAQLRPAYDDLVHELARRDQQITAPQTTEKGAQR
jgi:hypothetical protein